MSAGGSGAESAGSMDEMHKAGVDQFLANASSPITAGIGATDLEWRMEGEVRVFELTCTATDWEVAPGKVEKALTYNGIVPGPTLRVVEGQPVRVNVKNDLDESTSVHWHGQRVPNSQDGVPFITQPPIKPGESFTYEFVPGAVRQPHVPLAPQRRRAGDEGAAGRVHRRAGEPGRRTRL